MRSPEACAMPAFSAAQRPGTFSDTYVNGTGRVTAASRTTADVLSVQLLSATTTSHVSAHVTCARLASVRCSSSARLYVGMTIENFMSGNLAGALNAGLLVNRLDL